VKIIRLAQNLNVKQLSTTEWEASNSRFDFSIRLENDDFIIDAFDSLEDDSSLSYLDTASTDSLEDAVKMCDSFSGSFTVDPSKLKAPTDLNF